MKIAFRDSEQVVMNVLRDMQWHCLAAELAGKSVDYRARITQKGAIQDKLEEHGYTIECRRCTFHRHKGNVQMRRIYSAKRTPVTEEEWERVYESL